MAEIIEGKWEDLAGRQDLQGRRVRVVVLDEREEGAGDPWAKVPPGVDGSARGD